MSSNAPPSDLPLLQPARSHNPTTTTAAHMDQRRVLAHRSDAEIAQGSRYGAAAVNRGHGSSASRREASFLQRMAPIAAAVVLGCALSLIVQHQLGSPAIVDLTHGNLQQHAVISELDVLAACPQTSDAASKSTQPKDDGTGWFLGGPDPELLKTQLPSISSVEDLPVHWDWRDYNGTGISLVTSIQNQMVPKPCGSCWAFGTISALSDRIRIAKYRKYGTLGPEVILSPQVLMDCGMRSFGSCHGGDPRYAHKWIHENGIVDVTCNPYIASHPSWLGGGSCGETQCRKCYMNGECKVLTTATKYRISEYGTLNATTLPEFELEAMNEIYHRGPIVVSMYSLAPEYREFAGGYVLRDSTKYPGTTHVVSLIGWGTDEHGVKYWIVRNSDGTNWGDAGFFRVERGVNTYNIESHAAWSVPIV